MLTALLDSLAKIVGAEHVIAEDRGFGDYGRDAAGFEGVPLVVVRPQDEDEVAKIVRLANHTRTPMVARGAGSSLTGAVVPRKAIVVDMNRLNRILDIDELNWRVTVQPGVVLDALNAALRDCGFFFPPDPASSSQATIGGAIAEGAGGLRCIKYGTMREWVLSLRVVLPDGQVSSFGEPLLKNRAGYDLVRLFVGSEGTLGIITEASLRILPLTESSTLRLIAPFQAWSQAGAAIQEIRRARIVPGLLEFMDRDTIATLNKIANLGMKESEAALMIDLEASTDEALTKIRDRIGEILLRSGAQEIYAAESESDRNRILNARREVYYALTRTAPSNMAEDVVVPIDRLIEYLEKLKVIASKYRLRIPVAGHAGDGNVHPLILFEGADRSARRRAESAFKEICRFAIEIGGTITGEHGIGVQKIGLLEEQLRAHHGLASLRMMKQIKRIFDPLNLMNPGKLLQLETS